MADNAETVFKPGLEGVIAFETEIAEPDKEGGSLRYRGVDIEDLVGRVTSATCGGCWSTAGSSPACRRPSRSRCRCTPATSGSTCRAPSRCWRRPGACGSCIDIDDAAGPRRPGPRLGHGAVVRRPVGPRHRAADGAAEARSTRRETIVERFMIRWRGEPDPEHVKAVDAYFVSAAEHGMNASTFTSRVVASTGADAAACLSVGDRRAVRPAARRRAVAGCSRCSTRWSGRATPRSTSRGCSTPSERLMGFGHRVYRAEDPRARVLRRTAKELGVPPVRGRRGAGEGRARRAQGAPARPGAGHQRRVLVRGGARLRRGAGAHVHLDVHLRPHGRLERAHPRAEAHRAADPPVGALRRAGTAQAGGRARRQLDAGPGVERRAPCADGAGPRPDSLVP